LVVVLFEQALQNPHSGTFEEMRSASITATEEGGEKDEWEEDQCL